MTAFKTHLDIIEKFKLIGKIMNEGRIGKLLCLVL